MFVQKYDEEAWLERKLKLLFSSLNGGPSLFASLMQVYLHLAVNVFELITKDVKNSLDKNPQLWLRRGVLEGCFRLLDVARNTNYDPLEILEYSIKPLF
jgi:hypothetical protein